MEKINSSKIQKFLSSLNDVEFRFIRLQINMASDDRQLIMDYNLSKEDFCEAMNIINYQYDDYIKGGMTFSVETMSRIQALSCRLYSTRAITGKEKS